MGLEHRGYIAGPIEFDEEQGLFHGIVAGLRDVVTFAGRDADELKAAFRDSVEDYLAYCADQPKSMDRPADQGGLARISHPR